MFNSLGKRSQSYDKQHLVPFIEDKISAGNKLLTFQIDKIKAGIAICRDMDYPYPAKSYGTMQTKILFVPAWDFRVDARVHTFGAITRGIENTYTLVRAARDGYLSVTSPTGSLIAEKITFQNQNILIVDVPIWN